MSNSLAFALHAPTAIEFGPGVAARAGERTAALGVRHAMLVMDRAMAEAQACHDVQAALRAAGVAVTLYAEVELDPTSASIAHGAAAFRASGADGLVALGGGSAMDSAKALGVLARAGGDAIAPYFLGGEPVPGMPPLVCLPTTAGTGSEVTWIAVVTHELQKRVVRDPKLAPAVALIDPLLTLTMPPGLTASTGLDALAHALEALTSGYPNPYADALALDAAGRVARWLPRAVERGDDVDARGELALAATLAGLAFLSSRLHLGHAVGHSLGTFYKLSHGLACAICLPALLELLEPARSEPLARAAAAMGASTAAAGVAELLRRVGAPGVAAATGTSDVARLVELVIREERLIANSPLRPTREEWGLVMERSL